MRTAKAGLFELRSEWQARADAQLDMEHVEAMAEAIRDGAQIPPVHVVEQSDGSLALVDGYHRFSAFLKAGVERIPYELVGSEVSLEWTLARANATNGRERTNADKRAAVTRAVSAPEGGDMSNVDIARWCCVSVDLVRSVRSDVRGAPSAAAERQQVLAGQREAEGSASVPGRTKRREAANRGSPTIGHDTGQADPCPDPLPFEPADCASPTNGGDDAEPWRLFAAMQKALAGEITRIKRQWSAQLKQPEAQRIVRGLDAASAACTRSMLTECRAPAPHDGCPVCEGRGYTVGPVSDGAFARMMEARRVS